MPTSEDRRLWLVKGAPLATPEPAVTRTRPRRIVTRRLPTPVDPAPVADPSTGQPYPAGPSAGPSADRPAPAERPPDGRRRPTDATADEGAVDAGAADGGADGGAARRLRRPAGLPRLGRPAPATAVLLAALCAALVALGVAGHSWYGDRELDTARQQALAAARQTTVNFVSISASSVDSDLRRISAGATGEFREQFDRGQPQVRSAVVENKVESRGSVLQAGLVSGDTRTAVALVAVDATVKNVHAPDGRPSHYRIQVDLTRDGETGRWLVSRLQCVG
jgi:Mce-associated membrane protein